MINIPKQEFVENNMKQVHDEFKDVGYDIGQAI